MSKTVSRATGAGDGPLTLRGATLAPPNLGGSTMLTVTSVDRSRRGWGGQDVNVM
jgi:hypothetical protein